MFAHRGIPIIAAMLLGGCVSTPRVSFDSDYNYAAVFPGMHESKPAIVNSRLERYPKRSGSPGTRERNGEWEFELIASRAWVNEALAGFRPSSEFASPRVPGASWWRPSAGDYDAFEMPYSSFAAAHLYVEKRPKDEGHIRVFIQRH